MKTIIYLIIVILIGWGVYALVNKDNNQVTQDYTDTSSTPSTSTDTTTASSTPETTVKEFKVVGGNFSFSPSTITVNKGDKVRIVFENQEGNHDWRVDEFNAKTKIIGTGKSDTIEFVADKTGSFEYYCSVGTHRQMGMKGTLIVK